MGLDPFLFWVQAKSGPYKRYFNHFEGLMSSFDHLETLHLFMLSIKYFVHSCSKGRKNEKGYDSLIARLKFNHFILNGRLMRNVS